MITPHIAEMVALAQKAALEAYRAANAQLHNNHPLVIALLEAYIAIADEHMKLNEARDRREGGEG